MLIKVIGKQNLIEKDQGISRLQDSYIIHFTYEGDYVDGSAVATAVISSRCYTYDEIKVGKDYCLQDSPDIANLLETIEDCFQRVQPKEELERWHVCV